MPDIPDITNPGPYGKAEEIEVPDDPRNKATLAHWLVTAPAYHPFWSQYVVLVLSLADMEGIPPAKKKFQGATHELMELALEPNEDHAPHTAASLVERYHAGKTLPFLQPINQALQFEGTDEEIIALGRWAVWGIMNGQLNAETADAPDRIREQWEIALGKTLKHIRGEPHER